MFEEPVALAGENLIVITPAGALIDRIWRRVDHQGEFMTFDVRVTFLSRLSWKIISSEFQMSTVFFYHADYLAPCFSDNQSIQTKNCKRCN